MIYEYRVIAQLAENPPAQGGGRFAPQRVNTDLEAALNDLADEGFRFVGAVTWGVRRGDQMLIMEREGRG